MEATWKYINPYDIIPEFKISKHEQKEMDRLWELIKAQAIVDDWNDNNT